MSFSAPPSSIPGSGKILLDEYGALNVTGAYPTVTGWLNSGAIDSSSTGVLALSGMSSGSINMASYGGLALGAVTAGATYSGVLTPSGSTYRLGGGGHAQRDCQPDRPEPYPSQSRRRQRGNRNRCS